jgi:hypothetical protein
MIIWFLISLIATSRIPGDEDGYNGDSNCDNNVDYYDDDITKGHMKMRYHKYISDFTSYAVISGSWSVVVGGKDYKDYK